MKALSWVKKNKSLSVPRRFSDRMEMFQFAPPFLTQEEFALNLALNGTDPAPLLETMNRGSKLFQNGWKTLQLIEGTSQQLGSCDGLIGPDEEYWDRLVARGTSPTPLEQYARCPFQYFSGQVLRLRSLRQKELGELPAQAIGQLCHDVLRGGYQRLVAHNWPEHAMTSESIRLHISLTAEEVFDAYATEHATGYFLTWHLTKEMVITLVERAVESDLLDYRKSGFRPIGFEVEVEGALENIALPENESVKVRGRLDRIDQRTTPLGHRIVDYKFRQSHTMKSQDRDLLTSGIRGFRLQPPLYSLMTQLIQDLDLVKFHVDRLHPEHVEFIYLAPNWDNVVERSRFDAGTWGQQAGSQLNNTFELILGGVKAGRYFILPDNYCDFCDFSTICRRFHGPTWLRAHHSSPAKLLRNLRKKTILSK